MPLFSLRKAACLAASSLAFLAPREAAFANDGEPALPTGQTGAAPSAATPAAPTTADEDFRVYWKNSLNFESGDKRFKFKLGGTLQNDWWFIANESQDLTDYLAANDQSQTSGTNFRRARLQMEGTLWENMLFKWSYDFATGTAQFRDAYLGWTGVAGLGTVLVGDQKEPIGLEFATSSNVETFIERGLPHSINPERNTGALFKNTTAEQAVFVSAGVFRPANNVGNSVPDGEGWAFSGRAAWSPVFKDNGERLVHLGINGSYRTPNEEYSKFARPEVNGMAEYLEASVSDVDDVVIGGLEAAANFGPLSIQGEYVLQSIGQQDAGSADWSGWYAYVSYFLTGEHRAYRRDQACFTGVSPNHDLGADGSGAWELALRYSSLDLGDENNTETTAGSQLDDITGGVNWYMNYNARVMLNYVHADLDGIGSSDAIALRFQVFF